MPDINGGAGRPRAEREYESIIIHMETGAGKVPVAGRGLSGGIAALTRNTDALLMLALFVVSLTFHALTSARTVTFSDSGDFLMALHTVGNCHGPGYPLYLMTAKLFVGAVPFGSLAFRASLYSGLFASLTSCLLYWIVLRLGRSRLGGAVAALAFCFSYTFWYQSAIPETYSLNTFFIALLVVLALRWEKLTREGRARSADNTLGLFALCYGLALANHFTSLFLLPAFLVFALLTDWRGALAPRNLVRMTAFFALGLLPYLYEPTAAFRGPAYNYGDPSTPARWLNHITLYYQRGGLFDYPLAAFPGRLWRYFGTLNTEFPWFAWLGGFGLIASFAGHRRWRHGLLLLLLFLLSLLPVMSYLQTESVLRAHFYYPSYMFFSIWIGLGASWLVALLRRYLPEGDRALAVSSMAVLASLLLLFTAMSASLHYRKVDKSRYPYARNMAKNMLSGAEAGGVVLADRDNVIFPCLYMQVVERYRTDVRLVAPRAAFVPGWHGSDLLTSYRAGYLPTPGDSNYERLVERNITSLPLYTTSLKEIHHEWALVPQGNLVRLLPPDPRREEQQAVEIKPAEPVSAAWADIDSDAREALLLPRSLEAVVLSGRGVYRGAAMVYEEVLPRFADDLYVPTLYSCATFSDLYEQWGYALLQTGEPGRAVDVMPEARNINPDYASLKLARAYREAGNARKALAEVNRYLVFSPANEEALEEKAALGQ